jgi:hypothetical protein
MCGIRTSSRIAYYTLNIPLIIYDWIGLEPQERQHCIAAILEADGLYA